MENKKPWNLLEGGVAKIDLLGEKSISQWSHDLGEWGMWYGMNYNLGIFWIDLGKFLEKNKKQIKEIKIIGAEISTIVFITWLSKNILGQNIKLSFENSINTKEKASLGDFDSFVNLPDLLNTLPQLPIRKLRELTEIFATSNSIISDALYQIDFGTKLADKSFEEEIFAGKSVIKSKVSSWQSYGRFDIRNFKEKILNDFKPTHKDCIVIPCTLTRPYYGTLKVGTSNSIQNIIKAEILKDDKDVFVITTPGVIPQKFWEEKFTLGYDIRVPDIWSNYIFIKEFFKKYKYETIFSYLNYGPYIEIFKILMYRGDIGDIEFIVEDKSNKKGSLGGFFHIKQ